jgi:hypothetical protein
MMRVNLADHKHLFAPPGNRLANDFLGATVAIHLGGVDQGHPQIKPQRNGGDFVLPVAAMLPHHPGAEPQRRHASGRQGNRGQGRCHLCCRSLGRRVVDCRDSVLWIA